MMKDKFERIAAEGVARDMLRKHGPRLDPVTEKVAVEINVRLNQKLKPKLVGVMLDQEDMGKIQQTTMETMHEILEELSNEYRAEGDWDAFAVVHFTRGRM